MDNTKPYTKAPKPEIGRGCTFYYAPEGVAAKPCEGCYKLHETAWLEQYPQHTPTDIFEVRFKNTRRSYYQNVNNLPLERGDIVAVEASPGHDIGIVSLTGDMVARQMRRVGFNPYNGEFKKIYRKAKPYDIERWQEAIALEHETMITARQIAAEMGLNMKIGDVEYQGDKIKAIFYYIADERVDFRELIQGLRRTVSHPHRNETYRARQEAGRIGGIGACGRELCCASWISNFSSVTTNSARMQEISLNPQKLAGQCSKLKCCLAYEYDTYVDARKEFPRLREPLQALDGEYYLVKTDILAGTMSFSSSKDTMTNVVTLPVARVKEIIALNRAGKKVDQLSAEQPQREKFEEPTYRSEEDSITRFDGNGSKRKGRNRRRSDRAEERENRNNGARSGSAAEAAAVSESRKDEKQEPLPTGVNAAKNATAVNGIIETDKAKAANRAEKGITVRANRATHATATGTGRATDRAPRKTNSAPNAGTPPANRTVNAATVRALAANSAGNVVRSVLVPKTVRDKTAPKPIRLRHTPNLRAKRDRTVPAAVLGDAEDATVVKATVGKAETERQHNPNRRKRAITTRNVPAEYHSDRRNARYELPFAASDGRNRYRGRHVERKCRNRNSERGYRDPARPIHRRALQRLLSGRHAAADDTDHFARLPGFRGILHAGPSSPQAPGSPRGGSVGSLSSARNFFPTAAFTGWLSPRRCRSGAWKPSASTSKKANKNRWAKTNSDALRRTSRSNVSYNPPSRRPSAATIRSKDIGTATFSITTVRSYSNWAAARANTPSHSRSATPNRNFIGIDIKGARMWRGAKTATERQMRNVGFLRTRIEMIASFFAEGEVDEIWITFPRSAAQIAPGQETAHLTPLPGPVRTDAGSRRTNQPQDRLATPLRLHASRDRTVRSALRRGQQRHLRLGVRGRNTLGQDRLRTDVPRTEAADHLHPLLAG